MKYQLVLQFTASSKEDFETLAGLEDELITLFGDRHQVDGHDFGSGEMNMFILADQPENAFVQAKTILSKENLKKMKAAYREIKGETYKVIWPEGYKAEFSIV